MQHKKTEKLHLARPMQSAISGLMVDLFTTKESTVRLFVLCPNPLF